MTSTRFHHARLATRKALAQLTPRERARAMRRGVEEAERLKQLAKTERNKRRPVEDVPFPARPELFDWYVLVTRAQCERKAALRLFKAGFQAACPMQEVEANESRIKHHKRHVLRRPALTSMVLAGFRKGQGVPWLYLGDRSLFPDIIGVISFNGRALRLDDVIGVHELDGTKGRTRGYTAIAGDRVRVFQGKWVAEFERMLMGRVISVDCGIAMIELEPDQLALFGGSAKQGKGFTVEVREMDLEGV